MCGLQLIGEPCGAIVETRRVVGSGNRVLEQHAAEALVSRWIGRRTAALFPSEAKRGLGAVAFDRPAHGYSAIRGTQRPVLGSIRRQLVHDERKALDCVRPQQYAWSV